MTEPRIRFNSGYWDGRHDQDRNQNAPWAKPWQTSGHPFDAIYGQGYWTGRYDTSGTTKSTVAWKARRSLRAAPWMP